MGAKESILGKSFFYKIAMSWMGADRGNTILVQDYIRPGMNERVIDIGCGPANILNYFPDSIQYVGIDYNSEYIQSAKLRYGNRGSFQVLDINHPSIFQSEKPFDLAIGIGVLHHLTDAEVAKFFMLAKENLKEGGRLVTFDGCYLPKQNRISKWLLDHDRGKFVRAPEEYLRLAQLHFSQVKLHRRSDLSRIPYDVVIMECQE